MNDLRVYTMRMESPSGKEIVADIRSAASDIPQPVVLLFHGFKGFKDWGFFRIFLLKLRGAAR